MLPQQTTANKQSFGSNILLNIDTPDFLYQVVYSSASLTVLIQNEHKHNPSPDVTFDLCSVFGTFVLYCFMYGQLFLTPSLHIIYWTCSLVYRLPLFPLNFFSSSLLVFIPTCFSPLQWVLQWSCWSVRLSVGSMMIWTRSTSLLICSKSAVGRRFCRSESF